MFDFTGVCFFEGCPKLYTYNFGHFCSRITKNKEKVVCTFVEQSVLKLEGLYSTVVVK